MVFVITWSFMIVPVEVQSVTHDLPIALALGQDSRPASVPPCREMEPDLNVPSHPG